MNEKHIKGHIFILSSHICEWHMYKPVLYPTSLFFTQQYTVLVHVHVHLKMEAQ